MNTNKERDIVKYFAYNIQKQLKLMMAFLFMLSAVACSNDEAYESYEPGNATVRLVFLPPTGEQSMRSISTDADEKKIRDLRVFIFDNTGVCIGYKYILANSDGNSAIAVEIPTHEATNCTLYAMANVAETETDFQTLYGGKITKSEIDNLTMTIATAADLGNGNYLPMFGRTVSTINITRSATAQDIGKIEMEHVCSKVNLVVKPDNTKNIKVTGWQLHNVPKGAYITDTNTGVWSDGFLNFDAVTGQNYTSETTVATYYLYQNYAGKNAASNSDENRNYQNAPTTASYITVNAETLAWQSVFRIYLGGKKLTEATDDYTDFNVYRNHNYTVTVEINGSNSTDVRITHTDILPVTFTATVTAMTPVSDTTTLKFK